MSYLRYLKQIIIAFFLLAIFNCSTTDSNLSNESKRVLHYTVSMNEPSSQQYHIELNCDGLNKDTIVLQIPQWMPGYYQIMNYSNGIKNISASNADGSNITVTPLNSNSWQIVIGKGNPFSLRYDVIADKRFVAQNWLDSTHGYIVPAATFLYIENSINTPVTVKVNPNKWRNVATGLEPVTPNSNEFYAPDFDILYDCPILIGNLDELLPFEINHTIHRFVGYDMGNFDKIKLMDGLKRIVQASVDIIGEVPYKQYTFIGVGPGQGGIEHLNNTILSFQGDRLGSDAEWVRIMKFIAHEYFHNYNVKRIRPFELGPFNYNKENRTNLLWVSEGFTVYYEYIVAKRAGVISKDDYVASFESNINATENNPGRKFQSLIQSSYNTWSDGPFGVQGQSISYYEKGPLVGLILDLTIRNATDNKKSLDDVMRYLYWHYYKELNRGFTDAEFQQACEMVAGISLNSEFEYVNTTKEIDYNHYLALAGLQLTTTVNPQNGYKKATITKLANTNAKQNSIYHAWLNE
ncbi:MAG: M61 family metallopeptidase [Bacteroidales bacterium]